MVLSNTIENMADQQVDSARVLKSTQNPAFFAARDNSVNLVLVWHFSHTIIDIRVG
jgi:hypothetical protein